jgi:HSP20 family protein
MLFRIHDLDRTLNILEDVQRTFDHAVNHWAHQNGCHPEAGGPWRVDQTDDAVVVGIDLPGVRAEDLDLTLDGEALTVKGSRALDRPEGYRVQMTERGPVEFTRTVTLPAPVDAEHIGATLTEGVLTVTLRKTDVAKPVTITIN